MWRSSKTTAQPKFDDTTGVQPCYTVPRDPHRVRFLGKSNLSQNLSLRGFSMSQNFIVEAPAFAWNCESWRFFVSAGIPCRCRSPPFFRFAPTTQIERKESHVQPKQRPCTEQAGRGRHCLPRRRRQYYPPDPGGLCQQGRVSDLESLVRHGLPQARKAQSSLH